LLGSLTALVVPSAVAQQRPW